MDKKIWDKLTPYLVIMLAVLVVGLLCLATGCVSKSEPCKVAPDCCPAKDCCKPAAVAKGCKCGYQCRCETCDCKPGAKCDRDCSCGPKGCKCDKACGCEKCDCVDGKRCHVNCTCVTRPGKKAGAGEKVGALELAP